MTLTTIVSYDGTAGDRDALELARVFSAAGAETILAYVGHKAADTSDAHAMLEAGAAALGGNVRTRVVTNPSTSEGLKAVAAAENANLIIFGSDYRTPANRVSFQKSAGALLDSGTTAVAIAPAQYDGRAVKHIGLVAGLDDHAAIDTAHAVATATGAKVSESVLGVDLLIFGSRAEAGEGKVLLSARNEITIEEEAKSPVLIVARGVALDFRAPLALV